MSPIAYAAASYHGNRLTAWGDCTQSVCNHGTGSVATTGASISGFACGGVSGINQGDREREMMEDACQV